MLEHVNVCGICGKKLYCIDGFFEGIHTGDKKVLCFECDRNEQKNS